MINFHSFVMVVVHLRATGDVPILKQSKFKVGEIISRFEKKGFGLIQLKIMDFSLQLKTCSETVSKQSCGGLSKRGVMQCLYNSYVPKLG
ncbi:hypothetical protein P8452_56563 [Trifolium repens]|nr:hypothetical protein P8452_56563 [Trifolium repens]